MISRRELLGITVSGGAALALSPQLLRALQQASGSLIHRAIPSSGEMLPVIGLQFQNNTFQDPAVLKAVLETLVANGGRFFDTMHQSLPGVEDRMAALVTELGIQHKLFLGLRGAPSGPPQTEPAAAKRQIEALFTKFRVSRLDLVQLAASADPSHFEVLKGEKQAGRVRYIGTMTINPQQYPNLIALMRSEPIDFIGVDYSVERRGVEETILPLARERGIGVVAYFPFSINSGALFRRVGTTPLPEWAAEFDATTWAQFFLKYVVSHPAVTLVRTGTSQARHMVDNVGGGVGRLPDEAMRQRMAAFIDALPPVTAPPPGPQAPGIALSAAILDRYVGEYQAASGLTAAFRRDGTTLLVRLNAGGEYPLAARSETRFQRREVFFEFQPDGQGKVTSAIMEQRSQRMALERK